MRSLRTYSGSVPTGMVSSMVPTASLCDSGDEN